MAGNDDAYLEEMKKDFFEETAEMLHLIEAQVLHLEKKPGDLEAINEIFRAAHTIKGGSATVGFGDIQTFTHALEDTLSDLRSGKVQVTDHLADVLLKCLDILTTLVEAARNGEEYPGDLQGAIALARSLAGEGAPAPVAKPTTPPKREAPVHAEPVVAPTETRAAAEPFTRDNLPEALRTVTEGQNRIGQHVYAVAAQFDLSAEMAGVGPLQLLAQLKDQGEILATRPTLDELQGDGAFGTVHYLLATKSEKGPLEQISSRVDLVTAMTVNLLAKASLTDAATEGAGEEDTGTRKTANSSVLRVDSERIDRILNLVGELTVNKSSYAPVDGALQFHLASITSLLEQRRTQGETGIDAANLDLRAPLAGLREATGTLRTAWQELDRITADLRELVMKIRMVTVGQIFNRIPRVVRDLARERGKQVEVHISGEDTEMDKSVVEELLDPMIHLVRNSVDHGIEDMETRRKAGKNPVGSLNLTARHEGNTIILEISDDGKGMDAQAIYEAAIRKGVIEPTANMTDREKIQLIFLPGFSTAKEITSISGRGVGMDVVRKRMEALSGTTYIETEVGKGSTIILKLPLTLTIMQALLVQVTSETYAIPITAILETLRTEPGEVHVIEGREVLSVRGEILSVVRVSRAFGLPDAEHEDNYAVVVSQDDQKVALLVDQLIGEQDIVIKALKNRLLPARGVAGAANLGDGTITFILDIHTFVNMAFERERGRSTTAIRIHA